MKKFANDSRVESRFSLLTRQQGDELLVGGLQQCNDNNHDNNSAALPYSRRMPVSSADAAADATKRAVGGSGTHTANAMPPQQANLADD